MGGTVVGLDERLVGLDDARHALEQQRQRVGEQDGAALLGVGRLGVQRPVQRLLRRVAHLRRQVAAEALQALVVQVDQRQDLQRKGSRFTPKSSLIGRLGTLKKRSTEAASPTWTASSKRRVTVRHRRSRASCSSDSELLTVGPCIAVETAEFQPVPSGDMDL